MASEVVNDLTLTLPEASRTNTTALEKKGSEDNKVERKRSRSWQVMLSEVVLEPTLMS
jgi:hypothetical protein